MALVAVFALVPGVMAQDTPTSPTFGLTEDEFTAFSMANGNSMSAGVYGYAFDTTLDVDLGDGPLAASVSGEGVIGSDVVSLSVTGDLGGMPFVAELRVVEGLAYISLDGGQTWYELGDEEMTQIEGILEDELPFDVDALASGDASALGLSEEAQMEAFTALFTLAEELPALITIASGAEDGLTTFEVNIPLNEIAGLSGVQTLIAAGIASDDASVDFAQAQTEAAGVAAMAQQFLSSSNFTYTQFVDESTMLVQEGVLDFSLGDSAPVVFDLFFDVTLDYNADTTVEIPANALPASELLGALGGM